MFFSVWAPYPIRKQPTKSDTPDFQHQKAPRWNRDGPNQRRTAGPLEFTMESRQNSFFSSKFPGVFWDPWGHQGCLPWSNVNAPTDIGYAIVQNGKTMVHGANCNRASWWTWATWESTRNHIVAPIGSWETLELLNFHMLWINTYEKPYFGGMKIHLWTIFVFTWASGFWPRKTHDR